MTSGESARSPLAIAEVDSRFPLAAFETVRARPVERVVFSHAKIVAVMQGRMTFESPSGKHELEAGDVLVLGAGVWWSAIPGPVVQTWTIYADEHLGLLHDRVTVSVTQPEWLAWS